jgi:MOSC domain-containing protein YiiM
VHAIPNLLSVNVGLPREVEWHGRRVRTSIWKSPSQGRVRVERENLEGDRQSDLSVHGGPEKAVYVYPGEHYTFWRAELPDMHFGWGAFGENLTTEGLLEADTMIGDQLQIGSAAFRVTQPRMPCFKLGIRFGSDAMVRRFMRSERTGFYLAVMSEGDVGAGDAIEITAHDPHGLSVADVAALYGRDAENQALLRRAVDSPALPEDWREYFRKRLWEPDT